MSKPRLPLTGQCYDCGSPTRTMYCMACKIEKKRSAYMPTPEQIAATAAEIRKGWSDEDEVLRRTRSNRPRTTRSDERSRSNDEDD